MNKVSFTFLKPGAIRIAGLMVLLLGGCAAEVAERDLSRPDFQLLSAPTITQVEILKRYGEPFSKGQFLLHGQTLSVLHYYRLSGDFRSRVRFQKHCRFYFAGEKYLGYSFVSGWPEEQLNFDEKEIPKIVKGKTSRAEVIALFGKPNGMLRYPATPEKASVAGTVEGDTMLDYGYHLMTADKDWFDDKDLRIIFDTTDIVKEVAFEASKRNRRGGEDRSSPGL